MTGAIMDKVWGIFGMDNAEREEYDDEVDYIDDEYERIISINYTSRYS